MQMPPYFPYHTVLPPPTPLHTNQHQQSFACSYPTHNAAHTQFPPTAATGYEHVTSNNCKKALKHSSRIKSRSKSYRTSTHESGSESNFKRLLILYGMHSCPAVGIKKQWWGGQKGLNPFLYILIIVFCCFLHFMKCFV